MMSTRSGIDKTDQDEYLSTILKVKHKYNVTRLSFIHGFAKSNLPVAIAYRPNSRVLAQSGGKGISKTQSLISALMESYECHTAENVDYSMVDTYSEKCTNKANPHKLATTLKDYRSEDRIRWCRGENIFDTTEIYVPFSSVSLDFRNMSYIHKREPTELTSNGLASGSSWDDACISAIYEVIERHSITTNEMEKTDKQRVVDTESIEDRGLIYLIEQLERSEDLKVKLYDNTIWDEFPTYKSIISDGQMNWAGYGTHSNPVIAATRAITEANQARIISISGSREDMNKSVYLLSANIKGNSGTDNKSPLVCKLRNEQSNDRKKNLPSILEHMKKIAEKTYLFRYEQIDPHVFVVRVISEGLHGYNYRGYARRTVLKTKTQQGIDLRERENHSPAAG